MLAAVWISARAGGARRSPETLLWCGVAATWFLPVFDTLRLGNISGFVALLVAVAAVGGSRGAPSIAVATLLKVAPMALLPGLAASGRRALGVAAVTAAAIVGVSVVLAPHAWADYAMVLPNLLAGSAVYDNNLAPASIVERLAGPGSLVTLVRLATLALGVGCAAIAFRIGRHPGGTAAAVGLGSAAMLLGPAAIWYHYLVALLPLAALAWPRAPLRLRVLLLGAAVVVVSGVAISPLATLGGALLLSASVLGLWPAPSPRPLPVAPHAAVPAASRL